jgi:hypothetical protein
MTEATGFEAKTIHRLLEVEPKGGGFKRGVDNPLDCDKNRHPGDRLKSEDQPHAK